MFVEVERAMSMFAFRRADLTRQQQRARKLTIDPTRSFVLFQYEFCSDQRALLHE